VTRTSQEATVSTDRTPKNLDTLDRVEVDPPRVLSHERFQFNFNVSLGARVRAMFGAPSWSRRKKRLDDRLDRFWREQNERAEALWIADGSLFPTSIGVPPQLSIYALGLHVARAKIGRAHV
jgi:hypothetical protein